MRNIEEVIKELEAHPDYIESSIWTVDRVLNNISFEISYSDEFYDNSEEDFDVGIDDECEWSVSKPIVPPVITKDMILDDEWLSIKDKISGELCDFIHEFNMIDVKSLSLYKPIIREMKINQIIK